MCAGSRTRPAGALPALHALQLRLARPVEQDHAVDLAVRMGVVLAAVLLLALHVHGRDGDEVALGRRRRDATPSVLGPVQLRLRHPAVLQALQDRGPEGLVVRCAWPVRAVQSRLEFVARCQVLDFPEERVAGLHEGLRAGVLC